MPFLRDNIPLDSTLDVKPRLPLGHRGTYPGLVLVHAHVYQLIPNTGLYMPHSAGPGHGGLSAANNGIQHTRRVS